jgi:hypothetical protein
MSGLLRRIPSVVLTVLFVLVAAEAHAGSYLFRLTEQEIVDIMNDYYPKGWDRDVVLRQMSEPFDCANFGDLCREIGEGYALQLTENAWTRAKQRMPIESIDRNVQEDLDAYELKWFERLYPVGVPARDAYWGVFAEPGEPVACRDTAYAEDGDFRVVQTSRRHSIAIEVFGRIKAVHFKKNLAGNYKHEKTDLMEVQGRVIIQQPGFNPVETQLFKAKEDAWRVSRGAREGGAGVEMPFIESCGGDSNNSGLFICTCSGELPFGF